MDLLIYRIINIIANTNIIKKKLFCFYI